MICVLSTSSILFVRMLLKATASTFALTRNVAWHAVWSTSTRISQSQKQRLSAKPSSPTSPRPSTSSYATASSPSLRKIELTSPLSVVLMVGKSLYLSTVTMKSTTSKFVSARFYSVRLSVSQ